MKVAKLSPQSCEPNESSIAPSPAAAPSPFGIAEAALLIRARICCSSLTPLSDAASRVHDRGLRLFFEKRGVFLKLGNFKVLRNGLALGVMQPGEPRGRRKARGARGRYECG